jgi:hypothetical protein
MGTHHTFKWTDFPRLPNEAKELIGRGIWSLCQLEDKRFLVITPAQNKCCNLHPQSFFIIDDLGKMVEEKDQEFYKNAVFVKTVFSFEIPSFISRTYVKLRRED